MKTTRNEILTFAERDFNISICPSFLSKPKRTIPVPSRIDYKLTTKLTTFFVVSKLQDDEFPTKTGAFL